MRVSDYFNQKLWLIVTTGFAILLAACGGSGGSQDPILGSASVSSRPRVILTTPAKTIPITTGVFINTKLTAKFSRDMDPTSLNATSFTVACPDGTPITSTVTYDATKRIAVLSHTDFPSATCLATITTAAKDTNGIALASKYVWSFTTSGASDSTVPTFTTNPASGETAVCVNKTVSVTFDKPIDPSTITSTNVYVTGPDAVRVSGLLAYDTLSQSATFDVTYPPGFVPGLQTVSLTAGIKDLQGHALVPASPTFTTNSTLCTPPQSISLGTISTFGAFGGGAGTTNQGKNTIVNGDLGTTAACTLFTGFHDANNIYTETPSNIGQVTGDIYCAPPAPGSTQKLAIATQAAADAQTAFNTLAAITNGVVLAADSSALNSPPNPGNPLPPGVYKASSSFNVTAGGLILDAQGDANAVWIFQIPSSLTVSGNISLKNGGQAKNVYWQVGSAATIGNGFSLVGTIIADAGITFSTVGQDVQTTLTGRAIGLHASVTMVNTTIVAP